MSNHRALAVANHFLRLSPSIGGDQMKLQKLVYISHGFNLAINHEPLVRDRIEAWDGGPVFRSIWDHIRDFGLKDGLLVSPITKQPYEAELTPNECEVLEHVWGRYGSYKGADLSHMTHKSGTPWYHAYAQGRNTPISNEAIERHYALLAQAGREEAAQA
ncbi:Panacea domain-containing protein [Asticcacaulis sp.]|uniref:Panacea domain-containing protein n=1 Tax=Asticcacaulis sp. TaxID=1872648 RepID=UPI00262EAE08|nr:Panacea domain-containing protein [Asticcacaulis sp.]